jgi:L-ascorbate metabolism protein UlaG (beta-lactamase superfamily)
MPQVMESILDFYNAPYDPNRHHHHPLFRVYITGDTMVFDDIRDVPQHFPDVNLALFHLGGTTVLGIVVTMDAKEGLEMFRIINPKKVIPIHYNDYDVFKSSLEEFQAEVRKAGLEDKMHYVHHGQTYNFQIETRKQNA